MKRGGERSPGKNGTPQPTGSSFRDINPHIPQYISQAPWYVSLGRPSLTHQRPQEEKQKKFSTISEWYKKGVKEGPRVTKFRDGACENCGSMTHNKKDCLERPRKTGAKYTGKDIAPDEHVQPQLSFDWDAKRDRWNGYNPDSHKEVVEEYKKIEMAKRKLKEELLEGVLSGKLPESAIIKEDSDDSEDEEKYADQADMWGQKFDSKTRTTVRNLRIREDTAKYLFNLDIDSAYYDPKTRSMRENPFKSSAGADAAKYPGENFVRHTGDIKKFAHAQMFAWEAYEHGSDIHPLADPTKLELMHSEFKNKKENFKGEQKKGILERYGGEEHLDAPPKALLLAQTEEYVEYSRLGNVLRGQDKAVAKSKYEEDVYVNNHTSVWGSFWREGQWGYACCHSLVKLSYCTGEAGKLAQLTSQFTVMSERKAEREEEEGEGEEEAQMSLLEQHKAKLEASGKKKKEKGKEREKQETEKAAEREEKIRKAMVEQERREKEVDAMMSIAERKRPYHSMQAESGREPTDEEMEAFRLKRRRADDPMAGFLK
jgi:pre-mRNA-processing factor SLU7